MPRRKVHLVGSVPLQSNTEVFQTTAQILGGCMTRFPDGETGQTRRWISMQHHVAADHPAFCPASTRSESPGIVYEHFQLRPGVDAASLVFGPLGYVKPARDSYVEFVRLRDAGIFPPRARFLVTFPTPAAFLWCYVTPSQRAAVEPAYLRRLRQEVDEILASIPHQDLAIQWDTVHEILMIEGARDSQLTPKEHIERLIHVADLVPQPVELGFHFCYGYASRKHTIEPRDTGLLVSIANALAGDASRPLDFLHMPVPRDRNDEAFFRPLSDLRLDSATELYLGLIHWTDGLDGALRRMSAASKFVTAYGIATECGLRARPVETIEPLLRLHAEAAVA